MMLVRRISVKGWKAVEWTADSVIIIPDKDHSTRFSLHNMWNAILYRDIASACTTAFSGTSTYNHQET